MGTPWVTQRGLREPEMDKLAEAIAQVLKACHPFSYSGKKGSLLRARIDFEAMEDARIRVRKLAEKAGIDFKSGRHGYPHFYYLDDPAPKKKFSRIAVRRRARAEPSCIGRRPTTCMPWPAGKRNRPSCRCPAV